MITHDGCINIYFVSLSYKSKNYNTFRKYTENKDKLYKNILMRRYLMKKEEKKSVIKKKKMTKERKS